MRTDRGPSVDELPVPTMLFGMLCMLLSIAWMRVLGLGISWGGPLVRALAFGALARHLARIESRKW